ncbi:hypothetical protein LXL04_018125 [Taraxacum kok-saghyz]
MDDDSDRSSEATQLEGHSTAEDTTMHPHFDDDATPLHTSPTSPEEDSTTSQPLTLVVSDLSDVPVKYEMQRDELERLKNQLQGSHQEALATVIAQAARSQISSLKCSNPQAQNHSQKNTTDYPKSSSPSHHVKIPTDGYNWRKYGQKQVKSPQGSRSYYKCTSTECDAKKIESCDQNNYVTKVVYKGHHKHDPPKKVFSGGKILSSPKSVKRKPISTPPLKEHRLCDQRVKNSVPKKPKYIVHAADDVGISADGYRWRKYGQKMVKGNRHPRNYYKCTCAGCGVTKHIEKAVDGTSNIIITYKGVHDHDKPVPKKRRGVAGVSSTSNILSSTESVKTNARMLLSVGFEIKQC